jgi:hypothetical protein
MFRSLAILNDAPYGSERSSERNFNAISAACGTCMEVRGMTPDMLWLKACTKAHWQNSPTGF